MHWAVLNGKSLANMQVITVMIIKLWIFIWIDWMYFIIYHVTLLPSKQNPMRFFFYEISTINFLLFEIWLWIWYFCHQRDETLHKSHSIARYSTFIGNTAMYIHQSNEMSRRNYHFLYRLLLLKNQMYLVSTL